MIRAQRIGEALRAAPGAVVQRSSPFLNLKTTTLLKDLFVGKASNGVE